MWCGNSALDPYEFEKKQFGEEFWRRWRHFSHSWLDITTFTESENQFHISDNGFLLGDFGCHKLKNKANIEQRTQKCETSWFSKSTTNDQKQIQAVLDIRHFEGFCSEVIISSQIVIQSLFIISMNFVIYVIIITNTIAVIGSKSDAQIFITVTK